MQTLSNSGKLGEVRGYEFGAKNKFFFCANSKFVHDVFAESLCKENALREGGCGGWLELCC